MKSYYDVLNIKPKATTADVESAFRRAVARYRPTVPVDRLFKEPHFVSMINAYLCLRGPLRETHDAALRGRSADANGVPVPLEQLSAREARTLMARVAFLRRETAEAVHLLRALLDDEPNYAPAWALLGEIYAAVNKLKASAQAYQQAAIADPANPAYVARMQQMQEAVTRKLELKLEVFPMDELMREERQQRISITAGITLVGLAVVILSFILRLHPYPGALNVPWKTVALQAAGTFVLMLALAYGRLLHPFERAMVFSSVLMGDRGRWRNAPYVLLFFVMSVASMWLGLITLLVVGIMEEEWPISPTIMMGICVLVNLVLAMLMYQHSPDAWASSLIVGGNIPTVTAMLGWWVGSMNLRA